MALPSPRLDDRGFEDLVAEVRSLIPRYLPEFTNHNESDPGITLLELFAWYTDLLLYRVNQVPDLHAVKLLQLLGVTPAPGTPAVVDLTFTTAKPDLDPVVPAGTQASAQGADGKPVVFELPQGFTAIGRPLAAVQTFDGAAYRDVTTANATDGQSFTPYGAHPAPGNALLLGFGGPAPCTAAPITLMCYAADAGPVGFVQAGAAVLPPPSVAAYEFFDGVGWQPLGVERDDTGGFTRSGRLVVFGPGTRASLAAVGQVSTPLYWLRIRMTSGGYDRAPALDRISPNTVTARAAVTVRDEVLGGSTGLPDQGPFHLSVTPVVPLEHPLTEPTDAGVVTIPALRLEVDEGSGFRVWQEVDDLGGHGPHELVYRLDRASGEVWFGDGVHGAIPTANPALPTSNIVARRWLAGAGRRTNVGAGTITSLLSVAPGVRSVSNRLPASGGTDGESLDEAAVRAPAELKAKGRAVTAEDFELLARQAGAARAFALARVHPGYPGVEVPGAVTVLVVPDAPGAAPRPSPALLAAVASRLDAGRLITTEVHVGAPRYRQVRLVADIVAQPDADLAAVRAGVADALTTWLHPLTGGTSGLGWPFGGTIYSSDLFRVALGVAGVQRVRDNQLLVELDDDRQPFCRDVELGAAELVEALDPDIRVTYS